MLYKIPLKNKNKEIVDYALVSKEDYELISKYKWHRNENYACGTVNKKKFKMHRYIMKEILGNNIESKTKIDHIDNNKLNNKRDNLRIVTDSENCRNKMKLKNSSSKYIGVTYIKANKNWRTSMRINKKL